MKPSHTVVGVWATGVVVLALIQLIFRPPPLEFIVFIAGAALVGAFGVAVLLAERTGQVGPQRRQPRRATAAVFAALGLAVGLTGLAYGWWFSVLGLYPLGLAAWLARGEQLPRGARPWPLAPDGAPPASPPDLMQHGPAIGRAIPVPVGHPAHAPPRQPPPQPVTQPSGRLRSAILLAMLMAAARAVWAALREGRRR